MREIDIQRTIHLAVSLPDTRIFRNNVGNYWQGTVLRDTAEDGVRYVLLRHARRIQAGLAPGSSDLIGLRSIMITPDMVGQRVAVFCGLEVKTRSGRATDEQANFIDMVNDLGGMAGIVRSVDDAKKVLTWRKQCG